MDSAKRDHLECVEVATSYAGGTVVEELLATSFEPLSSHADPVADRTVVRIWVADGQDANKIESRLHEVLAGAGDLLEGTPVEVSRTTVPYEDWAESWKRHFHTQRVSRRILIKPSWETATTFDGDIVLEIDPGMSFGTGQHETTRSCLQMLDQLAEELAPCPLLDAGCGSGILTLAAVRLGFEPVTAFDNDPQAVAVTRENLSSAGHEDTTDVEQADLGDLEPEAAFGVVVANILAPVLLENADTLTGFLAPEANSRLILSGILTSQYPEVRGAFHERGLVQEMALRNGEWTSGCFRTKR